MADNVTANAGSGGATFATDEDVANSRHVPYSKLMFGADGTFTIVSTSNGLPVDIRSSAVDVMLGTDFSDVLGTASLVATDGSAALTKGLHAVGTDGTNAQIISTNASGHVNIADGSNSITVDNAGTFAVQVDGSALTALQLIDDAIYTDGTGTPSKGLAIMGTDGTNPQLVSVDSSGNVQVDVLTMPTTTVNGTVSISGVVAVNDNAGSLTVDNGGTFVVQVTGDALTALQLIDDAIYTDGTGTPSKGLAIMGTDGTNPQLVSVDSSGNVQVDIVAAPTITVQDGGGSITTDTAGDVAHDAADSGNPVKIGGVARTADLGTLVANGDRVNAYYDTTGRAVVTLAPLEAIVSGVANSTGTSDTSTIAAQGAGVRVAITRAIISNESTTSTAVLLKDGSTTRARIPAPTNSGSVGGAIVSFDPPLVGTANTAWNFASVAAVTTMHVTLVGYKVT